jgi:hypothetical protein
LFWRLADAVPVTIRDARDSADDRAWIRATYRAYLSELSVSKSGLFPALGEWPAREEEFLAGWFSDPPGAAASARVPRRCCSRALRASGK